MDQYRHYHPDGWRGPYLLNVHHHITRLLEAIPSAHNGVRFCTGMHIMGGDVPALVDAFKGKIYSAQARNLRGRWPAAQEVFLGEDGLDFSEFLRLLDAAGYRATIGPEHLGPPRHPGQDLEAAAVAFLQRTLAALSTATGAT